MSELLTCEKWVEITMRDVGRLGKRRCGKEAKTIDAHGRNLCQKHFSQWEKKLKRNIRPEQSNKPL